jgi:hypothetical protein
MEYAIQGMRLVGNRAFLVSEQAECVLLCDTAQRAASGLVCTASAADAHRLALLCRIETSRNGNDAMRKCDEHSNLRKVRENKWLKRNT